MRDMWESSRRIYTAQVCPKSRETSGKENVQAFISLSVCCSTHCQCSFVLGFFFYLFVKTMSSPMFILEINYLNGPPSPVTLFQSKLRTARLGLLRSWVSPPAASWTSGPSSLIELDKWSQSDLMGQVTCEGRPHQSSSTSNRATDVNFRLSKFAFIYHFQNIRKVFKGNIHSG